MWHPLQYPQSYGRNLSNPLVLVFLSTLLSLAALGFLDDYIKVAYRNRGGVPGKLKLLFQFLIALTAIYFLNSVQDNNYMLGQLIVPFIKEPIYTSGSLILMLAFTSIVVVGSSNSVNLTDGKDGLAVGSTIFCVLTYGAIAYLCGHKIFAGYLNIPFIPGASEVVVFASAITGALHRLPVVQLLSGVNVHGRHRQPGPRRHHRTYRGTGQTGSNHDYCWRCIRHGKPYQ